MTTTVETSWTWAPRAATAWAPITSARAAVRARNPGVGRRPTASHSAPPATTSTAPPASTPSARRGIRASSARPRSSAPHRAAPRTKVTSATTLLSSGIPPAPAAANPTKSTLPVMLPVNTWSSAR
ncbi:Uncharacterised protein [Mycobacteroides abscessus]|nr:Uncharacterised protein [Mycobacteroides abscessus]